MSECLNQITLKNSFGHLLVTFCGEYQYNFTILYCEKSQHQTINPNNPQIQRLCSGHSNPLILDRFSRGFLFPKCTKSVLNAKVYCKCRPRKERINEFFTQDVFVCQNNFSYCDMATFLARCRTMYHSNAR